MSAPALVLAPTATCKTCGSPIVLETVKRRGERQATEWSDGMSSQPAVCYAAISLRHEPSESAP